MPREITPETFTPHVNTTFRVQNEGATFELELTEVEPHKQGPPTEGMRRPFTLIFKGPKDHVLPEGLHQLQNSATGPLPLYVIPIISMGDCQSYQVVFN